MVTPVPSTETPDPDQVMPPFSENCTLSAETNSLAVSSGALRVAVTVCDAVLVMKSPAASVSALSVRPEMAGDSHCVGVAQHFSNRIKVWFHHLTFLQ
jgi:hypothetical protein